VSSESGAAPTWLWREGAVRLFADSPGVVRVRTPYQNSLISMTLPDVGRVQWTPPETARTGVPSAAANLSGVALWPWLALLGLALLAVDWTLFGRGSRRMSTVLSFETPEQAPAKKEVA